jgi:hypothetical protein
VVSSFSWSLWIFERHKKVTLRHQNFDPPIKEFFKTVDISSIREIFQVGMIIAKN